MDMEQSIKKIEQMKKEVDAAEREKNVLIGRLQAKKEELKTKYDIDTIEEAQALVLSLKEEEETLEQEIKDLLAKIKEKIE